MIRILKIAGIAAAVLAGLLILAVAVVNLIPGTTYKSLIDSGVKSATGRDLAIEGDLDIKLFTTFAFKASGITFSNAEWGSRPHMASIENIEGEVALFPLLRGILDVTLVVDQPDLLMETNNSGRGNWQFAELSEEVKEAAEESKEAQETKKEQEDAESGGGLPIRPLIRKLHLNGTRIAFIDGKSGDRINVHSEKLHLGSEEDRLVIDLKGSFNETPLAFSGGFDNAEFFIDNQPANVKFDGHFGDAKLVVQGKAGPLAPTFDLDVTLAMDTDSIAAFSPLAGRDLPDIGPLSVSAKMTGKEGKYAVSDLLTTLKAEKLQALAKASIADLTALNGLKLDAKVDTGHLTEILKAAGFESKHPLPDSLNIALVADGSLKELAVRQFRTMIQGQGLNVNVTAEAENIMALAGVSADLSLETESLGLIAEIAKAKLPPFGPLKATAHIISKGENLDLVEVKANLNGKIIHAGVTGSIGDPRNLKEVKANVNLGVDSLAWLADYVKVKLPPLGSFKASANIASKGETFEAKNFKVDLAGDNITAKVAGVVGDLLKAQGIDATVDLGVQSLAFVSDYVEMKLPPLGPLKATAGIASKGDTFEARDIKVDLAGEKIQAKIAASVADVLKLTGINADINFTVDSLASLDTLVKQELPASGPVTLEGKLSSEGGLDSPISIATVLKSDGFSANITGSVAEPMAVRGIDLALTVEADSMQKVGKLTGTLFPGQEPVKLEGNFTAGDNTYELAGLHLQVGELDVKGQAAFKQPSTAGGRPRLSGKLHVGKLNLSKRQKAKLDAAAKAKSGPESKPEVEEKENEVQKERVFNSGPLPFGPLRTVDVDLELTVESLTTLQLRLEDMLAKLTLNNGLLSLDPLKARIGNSTFGGNATLDARSSPAVLNADIEMKDATFYNFGGQLHFLVDLTGSGDSIAAIMASLDGQLELDIKDATLKRSFMTGFGSGLLDKFNPFKKNQENTELICAIVLFDIEDGVAEAHKTIAAQMTDVTWFGGGQIDLKTEKINFGMSPRSRKALDISLGSLAKLVHVGGTLAHPKVQLDPKDVAVKYGKYTAAMATGGLSMAADIVWGKIRANRDACTKILKKLEKIQEADEKSKKEKSE